MRPNGNLEDLEVCGWQDGAVCASMQVCSYCDCVSEVKLWNSDEWACVVSCGETWISPTWLRPNWLLMNKCECSWTLSTVKEKKKKLEPKVTF